MPFVSRGTLALARVLAVSQFGSIVLAHTRRDERKRHGRYTVSALRCFAVPLYRGALMSGAAETRND